MLLSETLHQLPKVELHLHLEGAIPLSALWQLIEKYDAISEVGSFSQLEQRFQYIDFPHFIDTWIWKNNFLREYDDFTFIASQVAEDLASQNIVYVEAFYSPGDFVRHGLEPQKITEAIRKGLDVHADKITVNLVADLIRDFGPEQGMTWLKQIYEVRNLGVIGIGIGGSEQAFPPEPYAEVSFLKEEQIPIEMCPISNLRTGVVPDMALHPIRKFYDEGLLLTVNTDDPKMFNTSLVEEYITLVEKLKFSLDDIVSLIKNGIKSAWCEESQKLALLKKIKNNEG